MRKFKGSSSSFFRHSFLQMEKQARRGKGSLPRSRKVSKADHRPEPGGQVQCSLTLQGQLGQARQWEAEDISLNHRVKF